MIDFLHTVYSLCALERVSEATLKYVLEVYCIGFLSPVDLTIRSVLVATACCAFPSCQCLLSHQIGCKFTDHIFLYYSIIDRYFEEDAIDLSYIKVDKYLIQLKYFGSHQRKFYSVRY